MENKNDNKLDKYSYEKFSHPEDYTNAIVDSPKIMDKIGSDNLPGDMPEIVTQYLNKLLVDFEKVSSTSWSEGYERDKIVLTKSIDSLFVSLSSNIESLLLYTKGSLVSGGYQNIRSKINYLTNSIENRLTELSESLERYLGISVCIFEEFSSRQQNYLNIANKQKTVLLVTALIINNEFNETTYKEKYENLEAIKNDYKERLDALKNKVYK